MLEWLTANLGTILISAGLIVIVALIIRSIVRDKKAGISSCGAKCGACAMAGKCHGSSGCGGSALRDVKNLKHQNT